MKVLYINANPKSEETSYSRQGGRYFVENIKKEDTVVELNLYTDDIPLIDEDVLNAWGALRQGGTFEELSLNQQAKLKRMNELLAQFKEADQYVIAYPLWNLSITPMLKAYIDNITIAGETFKYTSKGPIGLLNDKKAYIIQASGGIYSSKEGSVYDYGSSYVKRALGFIGVKDSEVLYIEGTSMQNKSGEEILQEAYQKIDQYLAK
jgi:FMN-dependent NADH-azoreductase